MPHTNGQLPVAEAPAATAPADTPAESTSTETATAPTPDGSTARSAAAATTELTTPAEAATPLSSARTGDGAADAAPTSAPALTPPVAPTPIQTPLLARPLATTGDQTAGCTTVSSPAPLPAVATPLRNLWSAALEKLPPPDKDSLLQFSPTSAAGKDTQIDITALRVAVTKRRDDCERKRWRFCFRGRDIILRDKAAKVLAWLDKFKQVGDVAVNFDPHHAALPWAGVRLLLEAAVAEEKQMGALLVGVEKAAHVISRCLTYEALYRHELQGEAALADLEASLIEQYKAVLTFLSHALTLFGNSGARRALHAVWNPDEIEKVIAELEKQEASVDRDACNCERVFQRTAHGEHTKQLQSLLADLCAPLLRVDSGVEALLDRSDEHERFEALQWVSNIPYGSNHLAAQEGRTENTAEWVLQHQTYLDWRASSAPMILWLHGIPGAGKTKVVSRVVDDISQQLKSQPNNEGFAYFYFNRNDASRQKPSAALCSLVRQLALSADGEAVQLALMQLYRENRKRALAVDRLHDGDAEQLLRQFVDVYPQTTLVLDALDECDAGARVHFVDMLEGLTRAAAKPVKIFISSRLDRDIAERLEGGPNVAITATDNADDIARFVEAELARRPQWTAKLSKALQDEIVRTLCAKSGGMFQWAVLQLGQLFTLRRESDVRSRLGKLPDDLEKAYDELYTLIRHQPGSASVIAERAFKWVMCSIRPLETEELVAAVCQDTATDHILQVDIDIDFILFACSNLLVVNPTLNTCAFSHLSVQEYIETRLWSASQAHALAAKTCLLVLLADDSSLPSSDASASDMDKTVSPSVSVVYSAESAPSIASNVKLLAIYRYAHLYWHKHVQRHGEDDIDPGLVGLLKEFLGSMDASSAAYRRWYRNTDDNFKFVDCYQIEPINSASLGVCFFGFDTILSDLWECGFDVRRRNDEGYSLLHVAVAGNNFNIASRLLNLGLDVNTSDSFDRDSPFTIAAKSADARVLQMLLDRGANVNAKGGYYGGPLGAVALWGKAEIVQMLLDAGADVNALGGRYGCPLGAAAFSDGAGIVQMLLDAGADVNAMGGRYGCPLGVAVCWGGAEATQMLLDAGADVNSKGGQYGCPLGCAAYWGRAEAVQMLLKAGADINAPGGGYGCPIAAAAYGAAPATAQLLLERGACIDLHGGKWARQQLRAAKANSGIFVRFHLDAPAEENERDGRPLNAVISAALQAGTDNRAVVRALLRAWAAMPVRVDASRMHLCSQTVEEDSDEEEEAEVVHRRRSSI